MSLYVQKILADRMCVNVRVMISRLKTKPEKKENLNCVLHYLPCLKHLHCCFFFSRFFSFLSTSSSLVSCADVLKCSVSFCPVFDFILLVSESVLWGLCNELYFS